MVDEVQGSEETTDSLAFLDLIKVVKDVQRNFFIDQVCHVNHPDLG